MAGLARVLVHVRRGGAERPARFGESVVAAFSPSGAAPVPVRCGLERGRFLIADAAFPGSAPALLQGPDPAEPREPPPAELRGRGVGAAVAALLRAGTGRLLLTRRARTLRAFPNAWVPPGGHLEPGEELLDAALRELQEETGLRLGAGGCSWGLLGLWESIDPPRGPLRSHHVVAYLLLGCGEPHGQLEARLRPSEREVSACAWLEPPVLEAMAAVEPGVGSEPGTLPATVCITELSRGSASTRRIPTATLLRPAPADGEGWVSAGTRFALRRWLEAGGRPGGARPQGSSRGE